MNNVIDQTKMKELKQLESIARVLDARNPDDLRDLVSRCAVRIGFEKFMLGVESRNPLRRTVQQVLSSYPDAWRERYVRRSYQNVDPTVCHCQSSTEPLVWREQMYAEDQRPLWEDAREYGLTHGISIAAHGPGGVKSMVSLARDQPIADPRELAEMVAAARLLCTSAHMAAARVLAHEFSEKDVPKLTAREAECLNWAARGKTAIEIGMILGISEPTSIFHLNNVVRKFGVSNRMEAVALGVSLGVVY